MGDPHSTRSSFDATTPSYGFGYRFVQGNTNGPGTGGSHYYSWYIGLGSDYLATGAGSYGAMFAVDRNSVTPYLSVRYNENNSFSSWRRVAAGYADSAGSAGSAGSVTNGVYTIGDQTIGGQKSFTSLLVGRNTVGTNVNTNNDTGSFSIRSDSANAASVSFHRTGAYAINMGLGTDNVFRIGGWSAQSNCLQLDGSGNLTALANVTAYSDERLKKDWAIVATDFVERLSRVKAGTYTRIDIDRRQAGTSAQDWQKLLPEVVMEGEDEDKTLSLAYGNAALVSAVELAKRVVEQEERIKKLEALIEKLLAGA
jgi:hypothetical protein